MTPILELSGVRAYYGNALILDGVDLAVEEGECMALVGRNGAGKTTTLNTVFGIAQVRSGAVCVSGRPLTGRRPYEAAARGVAVVPQGRRVLARLTVEENLLVGAASRRPGRWDLKGVYELFPVLRERAKSPGTALSGGEMQMLAIGRALMANPRLVLLDEPSEGLAPAIVDGVADVLEALTRAGTALLVVEQHLGLVQRLARRYVAMSKGRIVGGGEMADLDGDELRQHIAL